MTDKIDDIAGIIDCDIASDIALSMPVVFVNTGTPAEYSEKPSSITGWQIWAMADPGDAAMPLAWAEAVTPLFIFTSQLSTLL